MFFVGKKLFRGLIICIIVSIALGIGLLGSLFIYYYFIDHEKDVDSVEVKPLVFSENQVLNEEIQEGYNLYVDKNYSQAFNHFQKLIDKDKYWSPMYLGSMYYLGQYVERDIHRGVALLEISAGNGNKYALSILGPIFMNDSEYPQDIQKGLKYLEKAAEENEKEASFNLGKIYYNGLFGISVDQEKAFYWINKSAASGNSNALLVLAGFYIKGIIVEGDKEKAIQYMYKSARLQNPLAYLCLYKIHMNGFDKIEPDMNIALKFLTVSAGLGNPEAQLYKGIFELLKENPDKAKEWLDKAKSQGYELHKHIDFFSYWSGSDHTKEEVLSVKLTRDIEKYTLE